MTAENDRAREWRQFHRISRRELALFTGFSESSIVDFERGTRHDGTPIDPKAWKRYRLACAAVSAGVTDFDWEAP